MAKGGDGYLLVLSGLLRGDFIFVNINKVCVKQKKFGQTAAYYSSKYQEVGAVLL